MATSDATSQDGCYPPEADSPGRLEHKGRGYNFSVLFNFLLEEANSVGVKNLRKEQRLQVRGTEREWNRSFVSSLIQQVLIRRLFVI